jgi:hypothetical protein
MRINDLQMHKFVFEMNGKHAKYVVKLVDLLNSFEPYDVYDPTPHESTDNVDENYRRLVTIKELLDAADIY